MPRPDRFWDPPSLPSNAYWWIFPCVVHRFERWRSGFTQPPFTSVPALTNVSIVITKWTSALYNSSECWCYAETILKWRWLSSGVQRHSNRLHCAALLAVRTQILQYWNVQGYLFLHPTAHLLSQLAVCGSTCSKCEANLAHHLQLQS